ncbi:MAG: PAS domain-containing protein, partial [Pseudomonadota bacterium]
MTTHCHERDPQSEERFRLAMEAINDGLWDYNLKTGETYFSPSYYTMLGFEPGELPASRDTWKQILHPEDREKAIRTIDESVKADRPFRVEFRLRTKSGQYRWILGRGSVVVRDENGVPLRRLGTNTDITDLKEAQFEKENLIQELQALMDKMNALKGLLPICSSCKRIRDDQGCWNNLEKYVTQHSTASFSHGMCPECMDRMYDGQDW